MNPAISAELDVDDLPRQVDPYHLAQAEQCGTAIQRHAVRTEHMPLRTGAKPSVTIPDLVHRRAVATTIDNEDLLLAQMDKHMCATDHSTTNWDLNPALHTPTNLEFSTLAARDMTHCRHTP